MLEETYTLDMLYHWVYNPDCNFYLRKFNFKNQIINTGKKIIANDKFVNNKYNYNVRISLKNIIENFDNRIEFL